MSEQNTSNVFPFKLPAEFTPGPVPETLPNIRICTVTIAGPGRADAIVEALESASWVDAHILIDPLQDHDSDPDKHHSSDSTVQAAIAHVDGPAVHVVSKAWDGFAAMRTFALDTAIEMGFDWAIILDTDEILLFGLEPRQAMQQIHAQLPDITGLKTKDNVGRYIKDRCVRLFKEGPRPRYIGRTHEYMVYERGHSILMTDWQFSERAKNDAGNVHKFTRDIRLLTEQILEVLSFEEFMTLFTKDPDLKAIDRGMRIDGQLSRWIMYLGQSKKCLGPSHPENRDWENVMLASAQADNFEEQAAWTVYEVAKSFYLKHSCCPNAEGVLGAGDWNIELLHDIEGLCALGLRRYPLPELAWLMGMMQSKFNMRHKALGWARAASAWLEVPRLTFKDPDVEWWICDLLIWTTMSVEEQEKAIAWGKRLGKTSHAPLLRDAMQAASVEPQQPDQEPQS